MVELIKDHLEALIALCQRYEVQQIELSGSALTDEFDKAKSDLDFLVAFRRHGVMSEADRYLGLLVELEDVFQRPIDLIDIRAARNPYFVAQALKNRVMLYAA
jgi:hypothetical protein